MQFRWFAREAAPRILADGKGVGAIARPGRAIAAQPERRLAESAQTSRDCALAAAMKLANSGCGAKGRDFNSG